MLKIVNKVSKLTEYCLNNSTAIPNSTAIFMPELNGLRLGSSGDCAPCKLKQSSCESPISTPTDKVL